MKLAKCSCGKEVEVKYAAGISPALAVLVGRDISEGYPRYYIKCECGKGAEIRVTGLTAEQRDRQKNTLIRAWNKRMEGLRC